MTKMNALPRTINASAQGAFAVVPHNTNPLPSPVRRIYIGGADGVIRYRYAGVDYTTGILWAGQPHDIEADLIYATGTTATLMTGFI